MNQLPEIIRTIERVSADVVSKAATYQAAILADVAGRRGTMHGRVAPVHQSMKVAGPAFTVEVRPGDNLMIHAAIEVCRPGDVLVVTVTSPAIPAPSQPPPPACISTSRSCARWLTSLAQVDGTLLGLVHQEADCDYNEGRTSKSLAIATSADDGLSCRR